MQSPLPGMDAYLEAPSGWGRTFGTSARKVDRIA